MNIAIVIVSFLSGAAACRLFFTRIMPWWIARHLNVFLDQMMLCYPGDCPVTRLQDLMVKKGIPVPVPMHFCGDHGIAEDLLHIKMIVENIEPMLLTWAAGVLTDDEHKRLLSFIRELARDGDDE